MAVSGVNPVALSVLAGRLHPTESRVTTLQSYEEYMRDALISLLATRTADTKPETARFCDAAADDHLVRFAGAAIKAGTRAGSGAATGWWRPEHCSLARLRALLAEELAKNRMREVLMLAAMIHARELMEPPHAATTHAAVVRERQPGVAGTVPTTA